MRAQGPNIDLTVNGLLFDGCGDEAAWWRDLDVTATNLTVGAGSESGMHLSGVRGSVEGVDAGAHDGPVPPCTWKTLTRTFVSWI